MNFCSDNVTGVSPEVLAALADAARGAAMPYGQDEITARLDGLFADLFECDVAVFPVATGSAANGLALSVLTPPYGAVYCHADSHINTDECGAPEFYTAGAKLVPLGGEGGSEGGKLAPGALREALAHAGKGMVHYVQPAVVSLTEATEAGTVYRPDEIAAICAVARGAGLAVHMDGARFANAVARLGVAPADLTWRAGVDVLCFGATKNGAMCAEAVVFFDQAQARDFGFRRKRGGHLFSKLRFLSVQWEAYLARDLWLRNARHANAMADRLAAGLARVPGAKLLYPVEANEIFVSLPAAATARMEAGGVRFYRWPRLGPDVIRLLTSFETGPDDVDRAIALALAAR